MFTWVAHADLDLLVFQIAGIARKEKKLLEIIHSSSQTAL